MSATDARREYEHAAVRNRLLRYAIELHAQSSDMAVRRRLPRIRAVCAVSDANLRMLEQGLGLADHACAVRLEPQAKRSECGANRRDVRELGGRPQPGGPRRADRDVRRSRRVS